MTTKHCANPRKQKMNEKMWEKKVELNFIKFKEKVLQFSLKINLIS